MQTILICTDFSTVSANAARYGAALAKDLGADVTLFYSYHAPAGVGKNEHFPEYPENEEEVMARLETLRVELDPQGTRDIVCSYKTGYAAENIREMAEECRADLIVLGKVSGKRLIDVVLGGLSTALLGNSRVPLLLVPENTVYHLPSRIALASDFKSSPAALKPLSDFALALRAHVLIINLFKEKDLLDSKEAAGELDVDHIFRQNEHSFYIIDRHDFARDIISFADEHEVDMIATVHHKHSLLSEIFSPDHIKQLTIHLGLPLLIFPESPPIEMTSVI